MRNRLIAGTVVAVSKICPDTLLRTQEVKRPAAGEDFDIAFVRWEQGDKAVGQTTFAAHPRNDG